MSGPETRPPVSPPGCFHDVASLKVGPRFVFRKGEEIYHCPKCKEWWIRKMSGRFVKAKPVAGGAEEVYE